MYHRVIVAIDFSESSQHVIDRAIELVGENLELLEIAHVVEPIPKVWGMESYALDPDQLQEKIEEKANEKLTEIGEANNITRLHSLTGEPAATIRELQATLEADAIVIGSHGHSGWKVMLGSTAVSLLHGATCDVLTVYVEEEK